MSHIGVPGVNMQLQLRLQLPVNVQRGKAAADGSVTHMADMDRVLSSGFGPSLAPAIDIWAVNQPMRDLSVFLK